MSIFMEIRCSRHPRYAGKKNPQINCDACAAVRALRVQYLGVFKSARRLPSLHGKVMP